MEKKEKMFDLHVEERSAGVCCVVMVPAGAWSCLKIQPERLK